MSLEWKRPLTEYGNIALLMGGWAAEREISLKSGNAVLAAMQKLGLAVTAIDVDRNVLSRLMQGNFDRAFIALHGRGGEDGVIQGALEVLNIPYTGSGLLGSSIGMHKMKTKQIWLAAGLPTPAYARLRCADDLDAVAKELGFPLMVKPVHEGSSIGMSKVEKREEFDKAWQVAMEHDSEVIAERFIHGKEYTVGILNGRALPIIRLETPRTFYDYEAKYLANSTKYIIPSGLSQDVEVKIQQLALDAFLQVGCKGWGRVDLFLDDAQEPWLLEVNTVPGLTDHSLVPMAASAVGIDFEHLVLEILETSF